MINREALKAIKPVYKTYQVFKFLIFQLSIAKANLIDRWDNQDPSHVPVPPARLRHRVHGSLDKHSFLKSGKILAQNIRDLCAVAGRDLYSFQHVLDFGCGSGRVLRNFHDAPESCQFYGTDIDSDLIGWCENNLPWVRWSRNGYQPPMHFADNTFDLIYGISVFTHLDEDYQNMWLNELLRIARPGACLILSVHGEHCIRQLPASYQENVHSYGFLFLTGATGRLKLDKLPDFYQTAFHTEEYIRREWATRFNIVHYAERGINNHQDVVILQKP